MDFFLSFSINLSHLVVSLSVAVVVATAVAAAVVVAVVADPILFHPFPTIDPTKMKVFPKQKNVFEISRRSVRCIFYKFVKAIF